MAWMPLHYNRIKLQTVQQLLKHEPTFIISQFIAFNIK